ncbi:MAG: hypothetical protein ACD_3C00054G0011 [uncultured bacterium (gcode 4)]|uniref:HD domain-containing protein n=1 Tax=uncultured bacterium (gcode 4) TaxID=1234023 RepID=K2FBG6_9BACT|nr:MAG: hypothetical protein ACD_3C00054G0011 [uncultured bacterium (gcode 4)]
MEKISNLLIKKLELVNTYLIPTTWSGLRLIDELQKIPRAWKHLRLDKNWIILPKRSVYDHLVSLWRNADILMDLTELKVDIKALTDIIAFHDLAEAIIWDTPYFTTSDLAKDLHKSKEDKDLEEMKANMLILDTFEWELKKDFWAYLSSWINSETSNELLLFKYLDRLDPIINIWRYINIFRFEIDIDHFLFAMDDFFINPHVVEFSFNANTKLLVKFFQDKNNALRFHKDWIDFIRRKLESSPINPNFLIEILENKDMNFIWN